MDKNIVTRIAIKAFSAVLFILLLTTTQAAATTVSLANVTVEELGDTVTIPIMVNDITNYGSGTIRIWYDYQVVHVTGVTGSPESQVAAKYFDNSIGYVSISAANPYGVSGDIAFANVTFTAVGFGSSPLNLTVASLYDTTPTSIERSTIDGSITVNAAATTVSLANVTVEELGDTVTIPIMVNDITNYGSGTIRIWYDYQVVHVTGVTGSPESQVAAKYFDNSIGYVSISAANPYGVSGDIAFANVTFTAVGFGSSPLNLTVASLYDTTPTSIERSTIDGSITVGGSYPKGDLDHNGVVADVVDVIMMIQASVGDIVPNSEYDLDSNGNNADVVDVIMMIQASVGDITL